MNESKLLELADEIEAAAALETVGKSGRRLPVGSPKLIVASLRSSAPPADVRGLAPDGCYHGVPFSQDCDACAESYGNARPTSLGKRTQPLSAPPSVALEAGAIADIAAERKRQISKEGWTTRHDDDHTECALASAALCYVHASIFEPSDFRLRYWPWDRKWWKPSTPRRNLVKAAALIVAEIERLDRLALTRPQPGGAVAGTERGEG